MTLTGTLTAGMAHEINTPVNFAHAAAQTIQMKLERFQTYLPQIAGDDANPSLLAIIKRHIELLQQQLHAITEGTSRVRDLVQDLRNFSHLDEAPQQASAIGHIVRTAIELLRPQYAGLVEIDYREQCNPVLICRPAQL